jgi:hypothetical protein
MRCRVALSTFTSQVIPLSTEGDDVWEQLYKTLAFQDGVGHLLNYSRDTIARTGKGRGATHLLWRLVASANEKPHGMSDGRVSPTKTSQDRWQKVLQGSLALLFSWNLLAGAPRVHELDDVFTVCDVTHTIFQAVFGV